MRTTIIGWTLLSGLASLALVACSGEGGDPSPADVPQGTASAQLEAAPQGTSGDAQHDPAATIKRFDKNGDGKLDVSELPEKMQKFMGRADADKDGTLTVAELTTARDAFRAKFAAGGADMGKRMDPANVVKTFDQNNDGKLDSTEVPPHMQRFMSRVDADKDGTLTVAELTTARENFVKEHFAQGDKNGDGVLTQDELGDRKWNFVKAADADNNGSVTLNEVETAVAAGKLHMPHRMMHHLMNANPTTVTTPAVVAPVKS